MTGTTSPQAASLPPHTAALRATITTYRGRKPEGPGGNVSACRRGQSVSACRRVGVSASWRLGFGVRGSAFSVQSSEFRVQSSVSAFGVQRSAFGVRRSAFGEGRAYRRSSIVLVLVFPFNAVHSRSFFNRARLSVQRSAFSVQRSDRSISFYQSRPKARSRARQRPKNERRTLNAER
jgi:hypothetical protein